MLTNIGLNAVRDLIANKLDKGELGTGGDATLATDTDLQTADATTIQDIAVTIADKQINTSYTLPSTEGATTTYREYKNYDGVGSVNYDRIIFTGISFTTNGTEDIAVTKRYFITSN